MDEGGLGQLDADVVGFAAGIQRAVGQTGNGAGDVVRSDVDLGHVAVGDGIVTAAVVSRQELEGAIELGHGHQIGLAADHGVAAGDQGLVDVAQQDAHVVAGLC